MKDRFEMRPVGSDRGEIWLYGDIGRQLEGITALDFAERLKALGRPSVINMRLHSEGGDVYDAIAIYNALSRHPSRVEIDIDGVALSAATLVMMAGDRIRIARDGKVMVHSPWTMTGGTAAELRTKADRLDALQQSVVRIYARRTRQSDAAITALLEAETWMNPEDALRRGFVDEITSAQRIAAHVDRERFSYQHVPADLLPPAKTPPRLAVYRNKFKAMNT